MRKSKPKARSKSVKEHKAIVGGVEVSSWSVAGRDMATYVRLSRNKVKSSIEAIPEVVIDLDKDGKAVGVEIL